jgi:long-chain acyl-CoA synthetase
MKAETLQDLLAHMAGRGDAPALCAPGEDGWKATGFSDLIARADAIAAGLKAQSVGSGQPVALFAGNSPAWVVCWLAVIRLGAVCVPIDHTADVERVRHQLQDSDARWLMVDADRLPVAQEACDGIDAAITFVRLGDEQGDERAEDGSAEDQSADADGTVKALRDLEAEPPEQWSEHAADPDAIVLRCYTSGTTGPPKAVPLSHRNVLANIKALDEAELIDESDRVVLPLPLHHAYPLVVGLMLPLASGSTVVFPSGVTGPALARALGETRATVLVGVPRLHQALVDGIEARMRQAGWLSAWLIRSLYGLSHLIRRRLGLRWGRLLLKPLHRRFAPHLRLIASGGAHLEAETAWRLEALGFRVIAGYGLVETTSVATFNRPGATRIGSAGRPPDGVSVRTEPVPEMEDGEVQIRGPIVFAGYPNNEEANAESFTDEGWFRSGDLGHLDEDGFLHVTGRRKEIIVLSGGKNVEPESVEDTYQDADLVDEIAVLERDDRLVALVVPDLEAARRQGLTHVESDIRVALGERGKDQPSHLRIADFALTRESLPRNHLGKLERHRLDEMYDAAERGEAPTRREPSEEDRRRMSTERGEWVMAWLEERYPDRAIDPDTSLQMDLGIDSLAWVNIGLELEDRLGITLSEDAISRLVTVRDLLDAVEEAEAGAPARSDRHSLARKPAEQPERWLRAPNAMERIGSAILHAITRMLVRILFRLNAKGTDKVPDRGPLIVTCNHQSDLDPFIVAGALPYRVMKQAWWGAYQGRVLNNWLGRLMARETHLFPVDDHAPSASLDLAVEVLRRDRILIWFPESWRSPTGEVQRFRPGIGALVERTGATVVPCLISGANEAMPRTAWLPRPRRIACRFGDPIAAETMTEAAPKDADDQDRHAAIAEKAREAVLALEPDGANRSSQT